MRNVPYAPTEFISISPCQALGPWAKTYALELAQELGSSEEMVACTLLAMFAAGQIGAECLVSANYRVGMSLFMAIGAEPSSGKTPIIKRMQRVLDGLIAEHIALDPDEAATRRARRDILESTIKGIKAARKRNPNTAIRLEDIQELADLQKELAKIVIPLSPLMGKMSPQSFVKELSLRNGVGILIDDEGALLSSLHRVRPEDTTPILDVWSNTSVEDITKHEQFHANNPSVVMLGMWQSGPLLKFFRDQTYRDNGLTARFLPYIEPVREPRIGFGEVSAETEAWYAKQLKGTVVRLKECLQLTGTPPQFHLSRDAYSVLMRFKENLSWLQRRNMTFASHQGMAAKLDVQAVRLAMALHAMEAIDFGNIEIDPGTMHRACCLAMFFGMQSVNIVIAASYEEMRKKAEPLMLTMAGFQQINPPGVGFTVADLCRPCDLTKKKCESMLFWMMSQGWIFPSSVPRQLPTGEIEQLPIWVPRVNFSDLL